MKLFESLQSSIIVIALFALFYLFVYVPQRDQNKQMQQQIEALLKVTAKTEVKPTNALPAIVMPVIGGQNPIPPISNDPALINTLMANERVLAELMKRMNTGLTTSQIAGIVRGLVTPSEKIKVGITDATVKTESKLDDKKVSEITVKELRENLKIEVTPTVKILELEKPKSKIATVYSTSGNGLSYRFSESDIFLLGKLALNGNLMLKEQDFKLGASVGKDVRGTQLEIQAGGCYNFQQNKPEVFIGGGVHF